VRIIHILTATLVVLISVVLVLFLIPEGYREAQCRQTCDKQGYNNSDYRPFGNCFCGKTEWTRSCESPSE
jgi:hypothetical protein